MLNRKKYFHNNSNSFLKIKGTDCLKFLQGLISNDIYITNRNRGIYSSLLSPQGKFMYDFFLVKFKDSILLECNKEIIEELKIKLNLYKLRSNVEIFVDKSMNSYLLQKNIKSKLNHINSSEIVYFDDPRFLNSNIKFYCSQNEFNKINKDLLLKPDEKKEFENLRINNIVPDFFLDAKKNESLLLELRFDDLNGINWKKGCYIGQELTAITKYRANIKKKLFGLRITGNIDEIEKKVFFDKKEIGQITSSNQNFGIAILKIKEVELSLKESIPLTSGNAILSPFIPSWAK